MPTNEFTFCNECQHAYLPDGDRTPGWAWLCMQAKAPEKWNFVTGRREPPYRKCRDMNTGDCPMFEPGVTGKPSPSQYLGRKPKPATSTDE